MTDHTAVRGFSAAIPHLHVLNLKPSARRVAATLMKAEGAPVCGRSLAHPKVGGWKKDARLHELRQVGFVLAKTVCECDERCRFVRAQARRRGARPQRIFAFAVEALPPTLTRAAGRGVVQP